MAQPVMRPPDPHYAKRIRDNFEHQAVMRLLGAKMVRVRPGACEIRLPFQDGLTQQHGYLHAGVTTTVMDSAGGYAAYTLMPAASSVLSIEFKVNFLAPARGQYLRAVGRVRRAGRTVTVCELEGRMVDRGRETLCATGLQTVIQAAPHGAGTPPR